MCLDCGCGDAAIVPVDVHESLLAGNDRTAAHNREHLGEAGVVAVNLMGSPGAGKTAVLEQTARAFAGRHRLGAVSGDLATDVEFLTHALNHLKETEGYEPDVVLRLPPTSPLRTAAHIDEGIDVLLNDETLDAVRPIVEAPKHPYKFWKIAAK